MFFLHLCAHISEKVHVLSVTAMKFPKIHNPLFIAIVATLGGMLFGFDISSMSAIILTDQYRDFFDNPSGVRQGAIGSSLAAGSVFGSAIAGPLSDWIGRRNSIFYSCFFWIAGTVLQTATNGFGMLVAGRILNGKCWLVELEPIVKPLKRISLTVRSRHYCWHHQQPGSRVSGRNCSQRKAWLAHHHPAVGN